MKKMLLVLLACAACFSCSRAVIEIQSKGLELPDKTVIHYLEAGQGPVLILVHGLGGSSETWRSPMRYLAKSYRVIALDLPGHGKSDRPRTDYSVDYYAAVVANFIETLGVKKAALAGNSLGGWIASFTALKAPGAISHLILVDSMGLRTDGAASVNLNPGNRDELRALMLTLFADPSLVTDRAVNDQWEYRKDVRPTVRATLESLRTKRPYLDDQLKEIRTPTLIIWGRQDAVTPVEHANRFVSGIQGSKLVVIDNAGHLPHVEQPRAFYRTVKRFVRSW